MSSAIPPEDKRGTEQGLRRGEERAIGGSAGCQVWSQDGVTVVELRGAIDVGCALLLKTVFEEVMQHGVRHLVVDLSEVEFVDSSGLGVFVAAHRIARSRGSSLTLCAPRPQVRKVFQLTKTDKVFAIAPDLETALRTGA
jgi:anti-sigma B factor antagonist